MQYLGDFAKNQIVHFKWNTASAAGASITRATDGTVAVYKDDGTTEVTTGVTDTEDHDSLTGVHHCKIETTDEFYAEEHDYFVVLVGAVIDGQTVNACLAHFSIANRPATNDAHIAKAGVANKQVEYSETGELDIYDDDGETKLVELELASDDDGKTVIRQPKA